MLIKTVSKKEYVRLYFTCYKAEKKNIILRFDR